MMTRSDELMRMVSEMHAAAAVQPEGGTFREMIERWRDTFYKVAEQSPKLTDIIERLDIWIAQYGTCCGAFVQDQRLASGPYVLDMCATCGYSSEAHAHLSILQDAILHLVDMERRARWISADADAMVERWMRKEEARHDAIAGLPDDARAAVYDACRNSPGGCWCGGHLSHVMVVDSLDANPKAAE